ncbi:Class I SAM-dependent methyltransferase [Helicobacter sp. NHP19-012]|uniref:Class I SAM-dependent methyltransferase n=1 Tax=Helicobacter gastrofelis TaxID=2849642 RepID=A0ABN6IDP2_9HELI|nr:MULTISPECIES: SAM-dependent methyltransferase [unclassified Helicobacter]BCZ19885.1 Class I SAM-dependent methyltransferase [Helicobacter sp. NHP19-012]GMB95555.1 Class I SAM-dependent methyltransferase [Helicobacter sp. NHP22-001]
MDFHSFAPFMHEWLYGKGGYYRHALIGTSGDFYTSVSTSSFLGGSLAFYLLQLLEKGELELPLSVVEIGAGSGRLMADLVRFLKDLSVGVFGSVRFVCVEPLGELATLQKERLAKEGIQVEHIKSVVGLRGLNNAFLYCNELWDSFACELVQEGQILSVKDFKPVWRNLEESELKRLEGFYPVGGCVPFAWGEFIAHLYQSLEGAKWYFISLDYGQYGFEPISFRGYKAHQVLGLEDILSDLKGLYQQCDLTYDIDFKLLESLFQAQGARSIFYGTQCATLLKMGFVELLNLFAKSVPYATYQKEALKAHALISPEGLGEKFKGLIVSNP